MKMVTETGRRTMPYAPVNNVLSVIRRLRDYGLQEVLNLGELERIGIPTGNAPRTLAALRFLRLVDEDGRRTPAFDRLGRAKSEEYTETLAEIIRDAYSEVFGIVDPAQNTEIEIADAFRGFEPSRQRNRMITLFMGPRQGGELSEKSSRASLPSMVMRRAIRRGWSTTPSESMKSSWTYTPSGISAR